MYFFDFDVLFMLEREKELVVLVFTSLFRLSSNHSARFCFINWSRRVYKTKRSTVIGLISSESTPYYDWPIFSLWLGEIEGVKFDVAAPNETKIEQDQPTRTSKRRKDETRKWWNSYVKLTDIITCPLITKVSARFVFYPMNFYFMIWCTIILRFDDPSYG